MKILRLRSIFLLLLALTIGGRSYSAEVYADKYTIHLNGEIKKGDFDAVIKSLKNATEFPNYLTIRSPGGDVHEATKIGTLIRDLAMGVVVDKTCNSACFFILSAGVYRSINDAFIGIHRPFYEKEYFAGLSFSEAELKYRELELRSRNYLKAMGVPTAITEKMFSIPSSEAHNLSKNEREFLLGASFAYDEWIKAKCEPLTPDEQKDFNPFDKFDEHPDKKYSSGASYKFIQDKYNKYEECINKLNYQTRLSILKKYQ